jgi:ribokinase
VPPRITVLGSINMDLVVHAPRFPAPGETLLGGPFATHPGGKGANQAIAAARLGDARDVALIGCVGDDGYGAELRGVFAREGFEAAGVEERADAATGVGVITVDASGQNHIVVASGANATVTPDDVERHAAAITAAGVLVLQLEIPLPAIQRGMRLAREAGVRVLLNAAPARELPSEVLRAVDVLVVNELEARTLAGASAGDVGALARALAARGPELVVVTLGERGAVLFDGAVLVERSAHAVRAVDTTAAGDAFVGAFARALIEDRSSADALAFASAAGACAVTVEGAVPSLPSRAAVEELAA